MMKKLFWQTPAMLLILMSIAMPIAFSTWSVLLNNFVIERAEFTGVEIGFLHSLREIPGFLGFTTIFILFFIKEQAFAIIALAILGVGVALTGFFPNIIGLYCTTIIMSIGFHYFEVVKQSLSLQWLSKEEAPQALGKLISIGSITSLVIYAILWCLIEIFFLDYLWIFLLAGGFCCCLVIFMWLSFPVFPEKKKQNNSLILRKRYWLYYALTFFSGARRQIFTVFAAFLMVEKFNYSASQVALLFLINYLFNWLFAEKIGKLIGKIGERKALTIEYCGLVLVFTAYAFVKNPYIAAGLYVIDHMFFALAIAVNTYFQKIASSKDISSTAGISFTINHIAAIFVPALLGLIWVVSAPAVFLIGACFAMCSLLLSQNIPLKPEIGNEVNWGRVNKTSRVDIL
tara:strand:- start:1109 stop:2311 length:1203 start_codon:yes stop_codon:yes gene_type:complete